MHNGGMFVGLGNPGKEYAETRHNFGFMLADLLLEREKSNAFSCIEKLSSSKNNHELWKVRLPAAGGQPEPWFILKPLTYMNNSGQAVERIASYYSLPDERIVVAHDELDIALGSMRFKFGGGSAGHKGINSIVQHLGGCDFYRLRLGIGKRQNEGAVDHVLGRFAKTEKKILENVLAAALGGFYLYLREGFVAAQQYINGFSAPE